MQREYEIKYHSKFYTLEELLATAAKHGTIHEKRQKDSVYARALDDILQPYEGVVIARLREQAAVPVRLTVKRRQKTNLDRLEAEVEVGSTRKAGEVLELLGLSLQLEIEKTRYELELEPGLTFNIDVVKALGVFVEIEWLTGIEDAANEHEHISALKDKYPDLMAAVLSRSHAVDQGYDTMLALQAKSV